VISELHTVEEVDDITSCCKCRQLITDPTTLPCLDSLCAKCFREVCDTYRDNSAGVGACPSCGDQFRLPPNDSETLPDRGFIDTLVALKKIANQNLEDNNCDVCKQPSTSSEPVAVAEQYCIECRLRMCAVCSRPHRVFPVTKNHNLVGLGLDSAKNVLHVLKSSTPVCVNHKHIPATVHCYQCSMGLCSQCWDMHASHESEVLTDDTYNQLTNKVKSLSDQLHQQIDTCKNETNQVQKLLSVEKEIDDKAEEIIREIQKQRDYLSSFLSSRNVQSTKSLKDISAELLVGLSAKRKALKFAEELLEKGSVEDILLNYRMLNDRVTRLHDMSRGSCVFKDNVYNAASPASLITDVCTSLTPHSK